MAAVSFASVVVDEFPLPDGVIRELES
jgi:hypothetical protein